MSKILRAGLGALLGLGCAPVLAATDTTTFTVTATVSSACTISATNLDFGAYVPAATLPKDGTSTVTTTCTLLAPYNIGLNAGTGTGATVAARKMTGSANLLTYSLYRDAAHLLVWGNTILTDTVPLVGTGLAVGTTVFGQIPALQNVAVGSYTDTITATVTF
jgi:spore coat protein U domain-containing protein, fimbrial subunit CupE1/2/3/6